MSIISFSKTYSGFDPRSIPGCQLWLDAADPLTVTLSGSSVTQWNDKSGNSFNFSTTSGTPTYVNSSINFPSGVVLTSTSKYSLTSNTYIFTVSKLGSSDNYPRMLVAFADITVGGFLGDFSIRYNQNLLNGLPNRVGNDSDFANNQYYVNGSYVPSFGTSTYSSTHIISGQSINTGGSTNITISSSFYTRYFIGNVYEILLYNSPPSTAQRQQVEGYLARKWGLLANLPATHPFKRFPLYTRSFQPTDIDGCQLWLDAADASTVTTNGTVTGTATLNTYATSTPQNVSYTGGLTSVSQLIGGTSVMYGLYFGGPTSAALARSATSGIWYSYVFEGNFLKVVKLQFVLTGTTLTVQALSAGYTNVSSNFITTSTSGSTNDTYYNGYSSQTVATSDTSAGYGVKSFSMNISSSGVNVANVSDKSGKGIVLSNTTGFTYPNNTFNGTYPSFYTPTKGTSATLGYNTGFTVTTPACIFIVAKESSWAPSDNSYLLDASPTGSSIGRPYIIGGLLTQGIGGTGVYDTSIASVLFIQWASSPNNVGYANGTLQATGVGTSFTTGGITVGNSGSLGFSWGGHICELIFYSGTFTSSQRQQVEGYLANKWGLKTNLPSTHPFKLVPSLTTAFHPLQISGCQLWLDGMDPNGNGTVPSDGALISTWVDKSGKGNSSTTTSGDNSPTYSLSTKALQFRSASTQSHSIAQVVGTSMANNTYTVYIVGTRKEAGAILISGSTIINNSNLFLAYNSSTEVIMGIYGESAFPNAAVPAYSASDPLRMITFNQYSASRDIYINGNFGSSYANSSTVLTSYPNPYIARSYTGANVRYWNWDANEILIFIGVLTASQRQQVEGYLAAKWRLQSNLPSTHPYKKFSP